MNLLQLKPRLTSNLRDRANHYHRLKNFNFKSWMVQRSLCSYADAIRLSRPLLQSNLTSPAVLIIPPTGPGSLGDEAMLTATVQHLSQQGIQKFDLVHFDPQDDWSYIHSVSTVLNITSLEDEFRFIRLVSQYNHFYCIGADMMDGFYSDYSTIRLIKLVSLAARAGVDSTILGFSFNEHPTLRSRWALATLPASVRLCCRDQISHDRLSQHIPHSIQKTADLAFLLQPAEGSALISEVQQWIFQQRSNDRRVIGINANNLFLRIPKHRTAQELVQIYVELLTQLFEQQSVSFLLIPHDRRCEVSDVSLANDIFNALPTEIHSFAHVLPASCCAAEVKAIVADLDLALTARMHLAIACLGQGTPAIGISYQDKFEGLFQLFNLPQLAIRPDDAFRPTTLTRLIRELLFDCDRLRQHIRSRLPHVRSLATANFAS